MSSKVLAGILALAALAVGAPLLASEYLPLLDAPNHLAAIAIWHHYDDPQLAYAQHYQLNLYPVPYWGYFGAVHLLSYALPLAWANKVFLALIVVLLPLSLATFLSAHGRPPVLGAAGLLLFWNYNLALGFVAYLAGVCLLLFAWALLARLCERPTRGLWVASVAAGFGLYFLHPLAFLLWLPSLLVYVPKKAPLVALGPVTFFLWQLVTSSGHGMKTHGLAVAGRWNSPAENARQFFPHLFDFVGPGLRVGLGVALALSLGLAFLFVERDPARRDRRPLWLLAMFVVLYFVLPEHLLRPMNWWMVNGRLAIVVALLAFACVVPGRLSGWRALVTVLPLCLASGIGAVAITQRFADFDTRCQSFRRVVARLPYNPSVLTLVYPPLGDPAATVDVYREFASYVQIERGGYNPWSWPGGFPMRTRPEAVRPAPPGHHPETFDPKAHGGAYEYFLTKNEPETFATAELTLVTQDESWRLWKKMRP
jgi:hypothetical protein